MARLKLPRPIKHKKPPDRKLLHCPRVDLSKEEVEKIKSSSDNTFQVSDSGEYLFVPEISQDLFEYKEIPEEEIDKANLISSECSNGKHAPVIDMDFPVYVMPSSKLGHSHLYIDKEITWAQYERILKALANAGLIEEGYLDSSLNRKFTAVRPVGVTKPESPKGVNVLRENALLRKKLLDKTIEVDHLQKELENGIPNEILEELKTLRQQKKLLEENTALLKTQNSILIQENNNLSDKITDMATQYSNQNVAMNPVVNKTTWS